MIPSRSAHGQMSTEPTFRAFMPALAATAPATICRLRERDTPFSFSRSRTRRVASRGIQASRSRAVTDRGTKGPFRWAGELLEGLGGADGPYRNPLPQEPVGDFPQGPVHVPAQRGQLIPAWRVVRQEQPGQPSGTERKRHGEFRLGVTAEHDLHG